MIYAFGDYELDPQRYELRHGGVVGHLEPQVIEVLAYLIRSRHRVVTKQELLDTLWPAQFISDATLHQRLSAARKAIGDSGRAQRCIKTIRGRGYRFVSPVQERETPDATLASVPSLAPPKTKAAAPAVQPALLFVEREAELQTLYSEFEHACDGTRRVVLISGEPGIGKTTLVEAFVSRLEAQAWVGYGQCVDQFGAGEAYRPVLEALGRLCRGPDGSRLLQLLRQHAPSWLVQMPVLLPVAERENLQHTAQVSTQARMLRELAEALDVLTAEQPLVLVLEDLHWSDGATLEWLAYVARRRDPARLLVLATYRPVDAFVQSHPLRRMVQELQHHDRAVELRLAYLSAIGVTAYLRRRFATQSLPEGLATALCQRTNGNPLFLVALVDDMMRQDVSQEQAAPWTPQGHHQALTIDVPESLRHLIEQQLEQVSPADQMLLEAASVAGAAFTIAAVAAVSEQTAAAIEARCEALARRGQFVRAGDLEAWPDGTVTARYHFLHALYQEVLYNRVSPGRRMRLHRDIGARKELSYGAQAQELAAELAVHFLRGRDPSRAVRYLYAAGENAQQRSAYPEAVSHLTTGLEVLQTLPDTPERRQHELAIRTALGPALVATQGYTAPDVEVVYTRAHELCQQAGEAPEQFPVLWGLWLYYDNRGALHTAGELGQQLLDLARRTGEPDVLLQAHHAMGNTLFWCGEFAAAQAHMDQALALYDPEQHWMQAFRYGGHDPGVCCLGHGAVALWIRGYPDQALRQSQNALRLAQKLSHPSSQAHALLLATRVRMLRQERPAVLKHAETIITLATEQGFAQPLASGTIRRGWALVVLGQHREGMAQLHQGISQLRTIGAANTLPGYLASYAEACGQVGQSHAGLTVLDEALRLVHGHGGREYKAELYRLQGELLLAQSPEHHAEASALFYRALDIAQYQHAKAWELRIAMSLSRLEQRYGKQTESRQRLESVYSWFTEGFDTADLLEAKALLMELGA